MASRRIFVYGTLLRGERAHDVLSGARFLGESRTAEGYALIELGAYPGLVEASSGSVAGEVYGVDEALLAALDAYEGHPALFRRVGLRLAPRDGGPGVEVEGYLYAGDVSDGVRLASGDWRERDRAG